MKREQNYIDLLIERARIDLKLKEYEKKSKAASDEDELLRMLAEVRSSRNLMQKTDDFDERY